MSWYSEIPGLTPVSYFKSSASNTNEIPDIVGSKFLSSKTNDNKPYLYPVVMDDRVLSSIPYDYLKLSETIQLPEESTICVSFWHHRRSGDICSLLYSEANSIRISFINSTGRTEIMIVSSSNQQDRVILGNGDFYGYNTLIYSKSTDKSWIYGNGLITEMPNNIRIPNISALSRNEPNIYSIWSRESYFGSMLVFNGSMSDLSVLNSISSKMWEDLTFDGKVVESETDQAVDIGYKYSNSISVQFHEGVSPESFYYRGPGTIKGRVLVNEKGKKIPYSGRVALLEETTRKHLGNTISDANGNFEFKDVNTTLKYSTIAYDETGEHVAVADFVNVEVN